MIKKNIYTEFLKPKSIDKVIIYFKKISKYNDNIC